jgi:hypothetical protein
MFDILQLLNLYKCQKPSNINIDQIYGVMFYDI